MIEKICKKTGEFLMKNLFINLRRLTKFFIIVCIATFIIGGIVSIVYKPIYKVTLNVDLW